MDLLLQYNINELQSSSSLPFFTAETFDLASRFWELSSVIGPLAEGSEPVIDKWSGLVWNDILLIRQIKRTNFIKILEVWECAQNIIFRSASPKIKELSK